MFDGATRANVTLAGIGQKVAIATRLMVDHDLAASVTDGYGRVLVTVGARRSADAAVETALADRELAGNRRNAGLVTDADVLQLDVHVSRAREQQILAAAEERIARARLNQVMGEPVGEVFLLEPAPAVAFIDATELAALEAEALTNRPDVALAALREQQARASQDGRPQRLPPAGVGPGRWELNGGAWNNRASGWTAGAVARVNVFHGFADKARLAEAGDQATRRTLEREKAETAARLDARRHRETRRRSSQRSRGPRCCYPGTRAVASSATGMKRG